MEEAPDSNGNNATAEGKAKRINTTKATPKSKDNSAEAKKNAERNITKEMCHGVLQIKLSGNGQDLELISRPIIDSLGESVGMRRKMRGIARLQQVRGTPAWRLLTF